MTVFTSVQEKFASGEAYVNKLSYADKPHPLKESGYPFLFEGLPKPLKNVLLMPGRACRDFQWLKSQGFIDKSTHVFAIEQDPKTCQDMTDVLMFHGYNAIKGNLTVFDKPLNEVVIPFINNERIMFDLIFLDKFGSFSLPDLCWVRDHLETSIKYSTRLAITVQVSARNNEFPALAFDVFKNKYPQEFDKFLKKHNAEENVARHIFLLESALIKFSSPKVSRIDTYNDSDLMNGVGQSAMISFYMSNFGGGTSIAGNVPSLEEICSHMSAPQVFCLNQPRDPFHDARNELTFDHFDDENDDDEDFEDEEEDDEDFEVQCEDSNKSENLERLRAFEREMGITLESLKVT